MISHGNWARKLQQTLLQELYSLSQQQTTAREQLEQGRFNSAQKYLDRIPEPLHSDETRQLIADVSARSTEALALSEDIQRAIETREYDGLEERVKRYLELKPGNTRARRLLARLEEKRRRSPKSLQSESTDTADETAAGYDAADTDEQAVAYGTVEEPDFHSLTARHPRTSRRHRHRGWRQVVRAPRVRMTAGVLITAVIAFSLWPPSDPAPADSGSIDPDENTTAVADPSIDSSQSGLDGVLQEAMSSITTDLDEGLDGLLESIPEGRSESTGQPEKANPRPVDTSVPAQAAFPFNATQAAAHQTAWANHLNVPVETTNSIGMKFVVIPPGEFTMGGNQVTLTQPFRMGMHEVTQEQYQRVMGTNPSKFKGERNPVEQVGWTDAVAFCEKLSTLPEERATGFQYRLPTEAEWEYGCRAGTVTEFSFGDDPAELSDYAWYEKNSGIKTHPVGEKRPNPAGLYDLHGNVYEWCHDWRGDYSDRAVTNPTGPVSGEYRVIRGGTFSHPAGFHGSSFRVADSPTPRSEMIGFPVIRVKAPPK